MVEERKLWICIVAAARELCLGAVLCLTDASLGNIAWGIGLKALMYSMFQLHLGHGSDYRTGLPRWIAMPSGHVARPAGGSALIVRKRYSRALWMNQ